MASRQEPAQKDSEEIPDKCPNCGKKGTFVRDEEGGEIPGKSVVPSASQSL